MKAGFRPGGIIDIGACSGEWSTAIRTFFPSAPILMVEAREQEVNNLAQACRRIGNADFVIALVGAGAGEARFALTKYGCGSSIFPERSNIPREFLTLKMTTLDAILREHPALKPPFLLKLDVQGAELEILKGAAGALGGVEFIQTEVALLPYNESAPLAAETVAFMDQLGFALFDITGFIRPADWHLVHIDMLFARKTSPFRPSEFRYLHGTTPDPLGS